MHIASQPDRCLPLYSHATHSGRGTSLLGKQQATIQALLSESMVDWCQWACRELAPMSSRVKSIHEYGRITQNIQTSRLASKVDISGSTCI